MTELRGHSKIVTNLQKLLGTKEGLPRDKIVTKLQKTSWHKGRIFTRQNCDKIVKKFSPQRKDCNATKL